MKQYWLNSSIKEYQNTWSNLKNITFTELSLPIKNAAPTAHNPINAEFST